MFTVLWALLLPLVLCKTVKVDITRGIPRTQWSSGWSSIAESRYFGGTLMSARDVGATVTYEFTGTAIRVYGTEVTDPGNQTTSSYILDGSTPRLSQQPMTVGTSSVLLYLSPPLEDTQHTLVIQNLVASGELRLDYFEVTESTTWGGESVLASLHSPRSIHPRGELQPAVIAGLVIASVAVLLGFTVLFILWRREYLRGRRERSESQPKIQLQSQDDTPRAPFLNESTHIEPFTTNSVSSQPSQSSQRMRSTTPVVKNVTPARPRPSREQPVVTPTPRRNEKGTIPTAPAYTLESISRLNLGLGVDPRDHSVVGQPSDYGSEASADASDQRNRENDGGISLLGSSETINPKVLRLPPDYRRFYP